MTKDNEIKLNICCGCMKELEEGQKICPFCGYDSNAPQNGEDMLPEGTVLFRKYLIGRSIGRGGFGITYLGYDLDLQLKVAIKEYFPVGICLRSSQSYNVVRASIGEENAAFSKGCEVFLDEARTLAKISSPNIVHVRDFFREHGTAYIVMDYVEGITLRAEMRKNGGRLPYERVLSLTEPLIQELDDLHAENIIHRDIKPENIMLVRNRRGEHLLLLDFGSARTYVSNESKTMTGIVTAGYSPLEQYSQKSRQGAYTDVYALCASMYHAITGVLPPASIERVLEGAPLKSFEECGVSVPKTVEEAIMHGLALKSTERTQTMNQLHSELRQRPNPVTESSGINQTPSGPGERKDINHPVLPLKEEAAPDPIRNRLFKNTDRKRDYWECECGYRGNRLYCPICYRPRPQTGIGGKSQTSAISDRKTDYWECECGYRGNRPYCPVCYRPRPR